MAGRTTDRTATAPGGGRRGAASPDPGRRAFLAAAAGLSIVAATSVPLNRGPAISLGIARSHAQSLADFAKAAKNRGNAIFGTTEIASQSFNALPQWVRVLRTMEVDRPTFSACARNAGKCGSSALRAWGKIIREARGLSPSAQLKSINRYFNRWPYKFDSEVYGTREYWATPAEFLKKSGDCEDYAIVKYYALRELGFSAEELRVVILLDRIRGIGHAVLAVYVRDDILILDSLTDLIFSHTKYKHYIPQYSMNETTRWAHTRV